MKWSFLSSSPWFCFVVHVYGACVVCAQQHYYHFLVINSGNLGYDLSFHHVFYNASFIVQVKALLAIMLLLCIGFDMLCCGFPLLHIINGLFSP
jgi:hypothetical protein